MFSLIARGKKGILTAVWWERGANGAPVQRWKSTRTSNRKLAKEMGELWSRTAQEGRLSDYFRQSSAELARRLAGSAAKLTTRAFLTQWMDEKKTEVRASTMQFFKGRTTAFLNYLAPMGLADADIGRIEQKHIQGFRDAERERVSARTVNHGLKCLRMIFKLALERGLVVDDPTRTVKTLKTDMIEEGGALRDGVRHEERECFEICDLQRLLKVCDAEWESMVRFGAYTGQRLSDIATLTWKQVDVTAGMVLFKTSKTGRITRCPMGAPFITWLLTQEMPDDERALVHPRAGATVRRLKRSGTLSTQFADLLAKAGLRAKIERKRGADKGRGSRRATNALSFHSLRHTYTTWMKQAGASAAVAMDAVGHDSAAMNAHYTHIDDKTKQGFADKLPAL